MKASAFSYVRAESVEHALELLAAHGEGARLLSGGQSLMPAMNLRLLSPDWLIDIGGLAELRAIIVERDILRIGALVRHVDLERSPEIAKHAPLLREAISFVAHPAIRNRGTLGGSLAHADPAAELPACMLALDAMLVIRRKDGERRIAASEFFKGIFQTALSEDELLVGIELPTVQAKEVYFFHEFARRHGDYAIAGVAASSCVDGGSFRRLRIAFFAIGDLPFLASGSNDLLNVEVTPSLVSKVAQSFDVEFDPQGDQQASGAMRRHLAKLLFRRCVAKMLDRPELAGVAA